MSESDALLHVEFDFNLELLLARAPNIPLQRLNLVHFFLALGLEVSDFALEVDNQMGVAFERSADAIAGEFGHRGWQAEVGLLLDDQIIDHFVFSL